MFRGRFAGYLVLFLAGQILPAFAGELYTSIPTGHAWEAKDINDKGQIVGNSGTAYFFDGMQTTHTLGLATTNSGVTVLYGLNNLGLAVGASTVGTNNPGPLRAFSWDTKTGIIHDLGSLAGPNGDSYAFAVNDSGIIVGGSVRSDGATTAVRFELDGRITDLGSLGGSRSEAVDINERGDIVGWSLDEQGHMRAFLIPANGQMIDLGTLGGDEAWAARINNNGDIVGTARIADTSQAAFLYSNGKMINLTPGSASSAFGINDQGTVVGGWWLNNRTAFVRYPEGEVRDLGAMTSVPAGDFLFRAKAINNRGEIAVSVFHPVYRTGVELTNLLKPGALSAIKTNGQLQLTVSAPPGTQLRLESSPDFRDWQPIFTLNGEAQQLHLENIASDAHFYRILGN